MPVFRKVNLTNACFCSRNANFSAPPAAFRRVSSSRARASSSFLFFAFTSSPHCHNSLTCRGLRVKAFDLYYTVNHLRKLLWFSSLWVKECGSQAFTLFFTPFSQGAFPQSVHHGGRGVAKPCGEGKNAKAFTLNTLIMNGLEPMGEGVKAKDEKLLTCACVRAQLRPVVKRREAACRRRRKTSGVLIGNGGLSEKMRGAFSVVGRKEVGRCLTKRSSPACAVRSHCVRDAHCGENSNFAGMEDSHREKHISASPCLVSWIAKTLW